MPWEVVDRVYGVAMSHTQGHGETMGSTLFPTGEEANDWMVAQGLEKSHMVIPARGSDYYGQQKKNA